MEEQEERRSRGHFVLVHGSCHGAWSWFKLTTLLESAGYLVTAVDLAASGTRSEKISDVGDFSDYSKPLMEVMKSLPCDERAVIVGHSFGGLSVALAMEKFPEKISAAVFVAAFLPDSTSRPSYPLEKYFEMVTGDVFLDSHIGFAEEKETIPSELKFGPRCLKTNFYQNCSPEDLTLGNTLVRMTSMFPDLRSSPKFTEERYGSVSHFYIVCDEDRAIPKEIQQWMIENYPPKEVKEIHGSDHMPMLSKPQELCQYLLKIAQFYS